MRSIRSSGVGNCLFLGTREWGISLRETNKNCKCPGVCLGGGMVTSKIEACISDHLTYGVVSIICCMYCAECTMHVLYRVYEEL